MDSALPKKPPSPLLVLFALLTVQALFGANYVISKIVVKEFPPLVWASIRIFIATVVMFLICILSRRPMPKLQRSYLVPMIGFALLGTVLNQASFLTGLRYTSATNAAVLNTLIPIVTLVLVTFRGQEKLTIFRGIGFALAFSGVLTIMKVETLRFSDQTLIGDLLNVFNCFCYATFLTFSKRFLEKHDPLWTTAFLFLYGTIGITLLSIPQWVEFQFPALFPELAWSAAYAILMGTLATYFLNFWALRHARSSQVALFIYAQPVVAALIAWKWYDQEITLRTGLATSMIFFGMIFALIRGEKAASPSTGQESGTHAAQRR